MLFSSKGQTLAYLRDKLSLSTILPLHIVKGADYLTDPQGMVAALQQAFFGQQLIVRSSCSQEDSTEKSMAGAFLSIAKVDASNGKAVKAAIEQVFASYKTDISRETVLVQPFLNDIRLSGVAFTCDINTYAPYYVINFAESNDTAAVTGGTTNETKTFIAYKKGLDYVRDPLMLQLIAAFRELEQLCSNEYLDIEFAVTKENSIIVFQVRPIIKKNKQTSVLIDLDTPLNKLYKKVEKLMRPHPFLMGKTTCFGVMPDWNPAEILGIRPKKLAISLYKELVTDNIWSRQRDSYGYRDLTSHPLMVSFCGVPYIDVRVTFNSFIPKSLQPDIADKLVNYYIQRLKEYPAYHDKVEFAIVYSCYYIGLPRHLQKLQHYGFTENEIKRIEFSLLCLTNDIIHPEHGFCRKDIEKIAILTDKHNKIVKSNISVIDKIYWLIEECKNYGTLPFAGVARAAFIAVQFLRSFVDCGILSEAEYHAFMASLNTVSKEMRRDQNALCSGKLSKETFLSKYGHIRPDTYNILSPRYDEAYNLYFANAKNTEVVDSNNFVFSKAQLEHIQWELDQNGFLLSAEELISFIKAAIEGREYLKFVFSRSVSEILKLIKELGERLNISVEDMAHLDISLLKQLYVDLYFGNLGEVLRNNIMMNKRQFECAATLKLPCIIRSPEEVYSFYLLEDEPNYITAKVVSAEVVCLDETKETEFSGKIVFISSADPGYDFLFSKNIAGLVTEFGGANSHMAIRCAELSIPAIIGAGSKYAEWKQYKRITIDCLNRSVKEL